MKAAACTSHVDSNHMCLFPASSLKQEPCPVLITQVSEGSVSLWTWGEPVLPTAPACPLLPSGLGPHTVPSCLAGGMGLGQTTEGCECLGNHGDLCQPSAVAVVYSQSGAWAGRNPVLLCVQNPAALPLAGPAPALGKWGQRSGALVLSRKQKGFTATPTMPVADKLRFMGDEISRRGCLVDRRVQTQGCQHELSGHLDMWEYGMDFVCGHRWRYVSAMYTYIPEE